jgi:hypothetical protein
LKAEYSASASTKRHLVEKKPSIDHEEKILERSRRKTLVDHHKREERKAADIKEESNVEKKKRLSICFCCFDLYVFLW